MRKRMYWTVAVFFLFVVPSMFLITIKNEKEIQRSLHPGDIVINKLGRRGLITKTYPSFYGGTIECFGIRLENGTLEYWTPAEISHIEME